MPGPERRDQLSIIIDTISGRKRPEKGILEKAIPKGAALKAPVPPTDQISEKNIDAVEDEVIGEVSKAIRILEDVLAKWDSNEDKPGDLEPEFAGFRKFHEELTDWEQRILKSRANGENPGFFARVERLKAFARICASHR